jgi:Zn-dependent protease
MNFFVNSLAQDPFYFFSWVGVVAFSICFHEYAHASMALKRGDDTAAQRGHLTLNPLVQMGPMSVVMLLLLGIAWGAVPVIPGRLRTRADVAMVSFAGPAANLLLSLFFGGVAAGLSALTGGGLSASLFVRFCSYGCVANGVLFVFNMLPVPMFDGWSVFSFLVPAMREVEPQRAQTISLIVIAIAFITPVGGLIWDIGTALAKYVMGAWAGLFALFA